MRYYAGIGSRSLSSSERNFCSRISVWLAENGWALRTGAALGADQAFAEGALSVNGTVTLCLPWNSYEREWVDSCYARNANILTLQSSDSEHFESVDLFHPAPKNLSGAARKLHARNSLIVSECSFVLAFPGKKLGGTGQGIRVARGNGIEVIRLDLPLERARVEDKIGYKL